MSTAERLDMSCDPSLRVVILGGGAVAQRLRRDSSIELVRARTALDAVGELADPIGDDSPAQSLVLVDPEAEPPTGNGELARFIEGLRIAGPGVKVLRLAGAAPAGSGYDGSIEPDGIGDLRRVIESDLPVVETPAPRAEAHADPDAVPQSAEGAGRGAGRGDESPLLEAILAGRPVMTEALALLRERVGEPTLRLGTASDPGVPVTWKERLYGVLTSDDTEGRRVLLSSDDARWLARWLRLSEQHAELTDAAFTDPLTGAWNRRYFDKFLPAAIERTRQRRGSLTLMVFDIDDFKGFNDRYGHAAGDEILQETVRLLRTAVRPSDRVCRIGGDEFAVVFDEPEGPRDPSSRHPENVGKIARRFQRLVAESRFSKLGSDAPGALAVSAGLATFPWDAGEAVTLVERADLLAIESKRRGKNAITFGPGATRALGEV
ncbi:MAG: GGDEF domain-containing protein [Planctomycetota bacterium]